MITVELAKPGPVISPYLYGQFIEHLGRCIDGGIWAEMLHDRKFLLDPGKSWEVVKPEGADFEAKPDPAGAYAGDHCMALWVRDAKGGRCGIRQGGLGVVKGKEYAGYAILANIGKPAPVEIHLAWGEGPGDGETVIIRNVGPRYRKYPFRFRAGATTDSARLSLSLSGPASLWVGCLSLMPADNRKGMRPDTLALIKKLAPPITRWPGGNFVSGYNWKDGIGERDRRPPRWERAWSAVESNDFGIDEFMVFCSEIRTEAYIAVNTGLGSVEEAVEQLEYVSGPVRTRWGGERARNGHAKPYRVVWWGIGNEMYGHWQLGSVPVEQYAVRNNAFVTAMRAKDPRIKIIAVGSPGGWNDVILPACAKHMDLLSGHHYTLRHMNMPFSPEDAEKYRNNFPEYSASVANGVRHLVTDMRERLGTGKPETDRVRLAVDEWGLVRDWDQRPDDLGIGSFETYYPLGDTIAIARGLHEILRSADIIAMANWAQTVNVIGLIKTSRTHAVMEGAGHVFSLYRAHLGGVHVPVSVPDGVPVDAVAGWNRKKKVLSIGLINHSLDRSVTAALQLSGGTATKRLAGWRITGPDLFAVNVPGKPEQVAPTSLSRDLSLDQPLDLPPLSITLLKLKVR